MQDAVLRLRVALSDGQRRLFPLAVPETDRALISDMRYRARHNVGSMLPREKSLDPKTYLEWMVEGGSSKAWSSHVPPTRLG
jgi:hypothetical protein